MTRKSMRAFSVSLILAVGFASLTSTSVAAEDSVLADVSTLSTPIGSQIVDGPDGAVEAVAVGADGTRYLGGSFTQWGSQTGRGAVFAPQGGEVNRTFPTVDGVIHAVLPDGAGGYYIGGDFTTVGGVARSRAAHILGTGQVNPTWNPAADGIVMDFALWGSTVFVAGYFDNIGGQTRTSLAALNASTGAADPNWVANTGSVDDHVDDLEISNGVLYAGGVYTTIDGQTRNGLAAIDATTGDATAWTPNPTREFVAPFIYSLALSGTTLYVGGKFDGMGGQTRANVAAVDTTVNTNNALPFNPGVSNSVFSMAVVNDVVYATGAFLEACLDNTTTCWDQVSEQPQSRLRLAAFTTAGGLVDSWNPGANNLVHDIAISGSTAYIGGQFTTVAGENRSRLAAVSLTDGSLDAQWNPGANNTVWSMGSGGTTVYAGGDFTMAGLQDRKRLAAVKDGQLVTTWNPGADDTVYTLDVANGVVYAGGNFTNVCLDASSTCWNSTAAQTRNRAASFTTGGALGSWNPDVDAAVQVVKVEGTTVYTGGSFRNVCQSAASSCWNETSSQNRNFVTAFNTNGALESWYPDASSTVYAIAVSGSTVYIGGAFLRVCWSGSCGPSTTRNRIAAFNTAGELQSWNPASNSVVHALVASGSVVYAGGEFNTIGGQTRYALAALNTGSNTATAWNPNPTDSATPHVYTLNLSGTTLYAGGQFDTIGGQSRPHVAALDTTTNSNMATSWNPAPNNNVHSLAVVTPPSGEVVPLGSVQPMSIGGSGVLFGGTFTSMNPDYSTSGASSRYLSEVIGSGSVPGAPSTVIINGTDDGQVSVGFTAPTTIGGGAVDSYQFEVASSDQNYENWAAATVAAACTASPCTVNGLTNGTRYRVRVQAVNSQGAGAYSPASNWFVPQSQASRPSLPTVFGGAPSERSIVATWNAATSPGTGATSINRYRVFAFDGATMVRICQTAGATPATTCTVTDLSNGTPYSLRIRTFNNLNIWSDLSAPTGTITPVPD